MNSVQSRAPRRSRRILATASAVALLTMGFASTGNVAEAAAGGTLSFTPSSTAAAPLLVTSGVGGEVSVTVKNTDAKGSTSALKVQLFSSDPAFQVNGGCNAVALGAGKTCTFVVSYTAAAPTQDATASVSVSSKKPGIVAANTAFFKVVGVAPRAVLTPAAGLEFGSVQLGHTTAGQGVTLTNSGNAPLAIARFGLGGSNPGDFALSGFTCDPTLAAGASCTFLVTFSPTALGARAATLEVADNATGSPHSVPLTGTGVSAPDVTSPTLTDRTPGSGAVDVSVTTDVTTTFSENVTGVDTATMTLREGSSSGPLVSSGVIYDDTTRVATLTPSSSLQPDTTYTVQLIGGSSGIRDLAGNPLAATQWSFTTAAPATGPDAPVIGTATASSAQTATVRWTAPASNGGSAVTGYFVKVLNAANEQVGTLRPAGAAATSLVVTGLTNGATYHFTVTATNAIGTSAASEFSNNVTLLAPGAPLIGTATAGNAQATVRWTAPASVAGSAITGYSVRVLNAAGVQVGALRPVGAAATSLVVTGLTNGTTYHFTVTATNAIGTSAASASSNDVIPTAVVAQ